MKISKIVFDKEFLFMVVFVIVFLSIIPIAILKERRRSKLLKKLADCLHGYIPRISFYPSLKGEYQGANIRLSIIPESKNSPSYLRISLIKKSFLKLRIYKESFLSKLGKGFGIVHEVKVEDKNFDKDFLIFYNNCAQAVTYLKNDNFKNAIRELFNGGFDSLSINGKSILIQKPVYNLENDLDPQNILMVLQKLSLLAQGLSAWGSQGHDT